MKTDRKLRNYTEHEVVNALKKKQDLRIIGKQVQELINGRGDVGIRSRGKIDFLVHYCGYIHFFVADFKHGY